MFDVKSLAIKDSTVIQLINPFTQEPLFADAEGKKPVTITVASQGSREYRLAVNAMINRDIKRGNKKKTAEESRAEGVELLVAICLDSENLMYDGEPVKSDAQFRALLSDDKLGFIKTQIDETLGNVESFK
jgi:hypothetical protein